MPIFGVSLELAVERSRCHDGVDLPLPIRECIDYIESVGISFESVYKISGTKTKVSQIRKMYNHRQNVRLSDYDVPTATSLLKMFLRYIAYIHFVTLFDNVYFLGISQNQYLQMTC